MANKNEAKIKFTAETGGFNDDIKKSNSEMGKLRAEAKLNETQMKATGETVAGLEKQHEILEGQLKASQTKVEALSGKVDAAARIFGENSDEVIKLKTQLANAQTAEERMRQAVSQCADKLDQQRKAADKTESATQTLTNKIEEQQSEVKQLKDEYVDAVLQYGKNSKEAKDLAKQIDKLSDELNDSQTAMKRAESAADKLDNSLDDAGKSAADTADGFTVAKGAIADLASSAIQAAIGKVTEFVGWLKELPEATRELRQDMSTLETSFETAGLSTEQATQTWKDLYAVFGEDDRAVEASNLIAKMSDNQKDLNDWVTITKGVYGQFQDSLPVEGLAEASMETAKTGTVTGSLADALNWSSEAASMFSKYMSDDIVTAEDAFNEALKECSTEEERQALITETLTALYGESAAKYEEASGQQMEAKEATADLTLAQADLAEKIEPVTTAWDGMKATLIEAVTPAIEAVCGALQDALGWLQEHPVATKVLVAVVGTLAAAFSGLAIALGVYTAAQWLANSAMAPMILPILGIVAAIAAVVAIIVVVVQYWDEIVAACKRAWEAVKATLATWGEWINTNVIQPIKEFFSGLWDGIKETAVTVWDAIKAFFAAIPEWFNTNIIQPVIGFFQRLWQGIVDILNTICNAIQVAIMFIGSILSAAFQIITLPFRMIWENCKQYVFAAWEWIKQKVTIAITAVKTVITNVMNAIKSVFTTIWNAIKNVFTTVWNAIKSFLTPIINAIKSAITTAWNNIKSVTSTVFNAIKSVISTVWNAIKSAVTTAVNAVKSVVTSVFNAIKSVATTVWNGIKSAVTSAWNGIKSGVTSAVNSVKSTVSNVFSSIKSTATTVWNNIKNAITKPIEAAKDKIKGIIDTIKGFFSNLKLKFPNIKMPHFKITGKFSLDPPSVPKLGIEWYKNGGIMMAPTIFGVNGNRLMAGGEAGPEAIAPLAKLQGYITNAVEKAQQTFDVQALAAAIEDLANRPAQFYIGDREVALATASASDSVGGLRSTFKSRGLIVD